MIMTTSCPSLTTSKLHSCHIYLTFVNACMYVYSEKYAEGHGILEFSTDKAGQDVTPMNLKFDDEAVQTRGSTLNSISGKCITFILFFLNK